MPVSFGTRLDKTRRDLISRIGGTGPRLISSRLVTRENSGKIREIKGAKAFTISLIWVWQGADLVFFGPIPWPHAQIMGGLLGTKAQSETKLT